MTENQEKEQIVETDLQEIQIMYISETKFKISMFMFKKLHNEIENLAWT